MRVNGRAELACAYELAHHGAEISVEPLANLPIVSDLVSDMGPFYDRFPDERPLIRVSEVLPAARPPDGHDAYIRLEDCIECGLCLSAARERARRRALLDRPPGGRVAVHEPPGLCPGLPGGDRAGDLDPLLAHTLKTFAVQGNSYGKSARTRARWTKDLAFTIPDARNEPVDYVWFVGDYASFDERVQRESRRLATILHDAGVSFGLLFEGEHSAGNDVRRIGEEGLVEMLVEHKEPRQSAVCGHLHHRSSLPQHSA